MQSGGTEMIQLSRWRKIHAPLYPFKNVCSLLITTMPGESRYESSNPKRADQKSLMPMSMRVLSLFPARMAEVDIGLDALAFEGVVSGSGFLVGDLGEGLFRVRFGDGDETCAEGLFEVPLARWCRGRSRGQSGPGR